ncbi:hypothetical protein AUJ66_07895 [Candidatus Desantisbacteria bacterium CG1_02_38_46]|uniref:HTH HARE-type domain-containing protein n=3 Tax=unclassified Candidatus Desantisiibacteriota TaxID=3106372 RepID=A0A2H9PAN9_9BACT|nr:MAG: hypothetical protein AUJ66_07895 [Candidatus Desantisbacteria bacterium CG1_02_38_46]PIU51425.1 MAG: hypothetical protein COS91_04550 [Candidatus Desantisbacteria bacterium CG07_land_8_20_14_0_80_39_15]PIZ15547.1 MAG: hypothetical protein COY51_04970 [Candidatus Desantisbacteria bacterium CG_4_10_14_0_8_um_filter_39_17]
MKEDKFTWKDIVRNVLLELGGQGHLSEINKIVEGYPGAKIKIESNPTWQATIRRVARQYKIFEPLGKGVYKLLEEVPIKAELQEFTEEPEIDHGIAQGMLLTLGKIYGYETYAPLHDQTIRNFQRKPLRDFVSVANCTDIFKGPNLSKIREIDALWFDEDDYGLFPIYAFEVEETTRVKSGLDRLLKIPRRFPTRFFIIGSSTKEKDLFNQYINQTPFRNFKDKFLFRLYKELKELYSSALIHNDYREQFGIIERGK